MSAAADIAFYRTPQATEASIDDVMEEVDHPILVDIHRTCDTSIRHACRLTGRVDTAALGKHPFQLHRVRWLLDFLDRVIGRRNRVRERDRAVGRVARRAGFFERASRSGCKASHSSDLIRKLVPIGARNMDMRARSG